MSLDEGMTQEEMEFHRANDERVFQIIAQAKRECSGGVYPVEIEDFFDLYCNAGRFITNLNESYCRRYFRHTLECMGQGFSCVDEEDVHLLNL